VVLRGTMSNLNRSSRKKVLALDKILATVILAEWGGVSFADKAVDEESQKNYETENTLQLAIPVFD